MSKVLQITPSIGRTVHFVMPNGDHRPAIIVRVWDHTAVQLQVFVDGSNDAGLVHATELGQLTVWRTSVHQDADELKPGTWHAPERVD